MIKNKVKRLLVCFFCLVTAIMLNISPLACYTSFGKESRVSISPAFGGWENWTGSPNNSTNGAEPGVTQLLLGISDENGEFPDALNTTELNYTLTFDWVEGNQNKTKTITLKPATVASVYKLVRFETVLGEGENQFIPYKNQAYTVSVSVMAGDGVVYSGKSGDYAFSVPMFPVVNGKLDESYVYQKPVGDYPYEVKISQYHSGTVEKDGVEYYKSDWETWNGKQTLIFTIEKNGIYEISDISSGVIADISFNGGANHKIAIDSVVDLGSSILVRLPTEGMFSPNDSSLYSIKVSIFKNINGENLVAYTGEGEGFTSGDVMIAPETGDFSTVYVVIAVISVMAMAYILMPGRNQRLKEA